MTTPDDKPNLSLVPKGDTPAAPAPNRADRRKASAEKRKAENAGEKPPEAPVIQRRVYVSFVYDDEEGFERHDRMWVDGLADLRTLNEVLGVENLIAEQKKLTNVRVLTWKGLEG